MGFLLLPIWVWGSAWWPFGSLELHYDYYYYYYYYFSFNFMPIYNTIAEPIPWA